MGDMEIPDELIDQLLGEYQGPEQLTGPDGLINQLRKRLIERAAGVELEQHLGYPPGAEPPERQPNRRNGTSQKTLRTQDGPVTVELPRDRVARVGPGPGAPADRPQLVCVPARPSAQHARRRSALRARRRWPRGRRVRAQLARSGTGRLPAARLTTTSPPR